MGQRVSSPQITHVHCYSAIELFSYVIGMNQCNYL